MLHKAWAEQAGARSTGGLPAGQLVCTDVLPPVIDDECPPRPARNLLAIAVARFGVEVEPGGASLVFAPVSPSVQDAHSEASPPLPSAESTAERERAAKEAYDTEVADYQIYDVMRKFASSVRALALYDCRFCLSELEKLPHQHYELGQYPPAERAFEAVRIVEPYRLWDMEVYSTLLWHLQRNIRLSFLVRHPPAERGPPGLRGHGTCGHASMPHITFLTAYGAPGTTLIGAGTFSPEKALVRYHRAKLLVALK
ncbi:hypothetical protein VTO73DRAFT_15527 [Trametes versicolor]